MVKGLSFEGPGTFTVYGAVFQGFQESLPILAGAAATQVIRRPEWDRDTCFRLKELCAGLGGIEVAMSTTGGSTLVSVDRCQLACDTLRLNHATVVQGDLGDRAVRIAAHLVESHKSCILAAGVPCQGYSPQGAQRGFLDRRSYTLVHVLQVAWHAQVFAVVLECVPAIMESAGAMQALRCFASHAHFQAKHLVLDLADQWPMRRSRWWGMLVPNGALFEPVPWPSMHVDGIASVAPEWPLWPSDQELQLAWTDEEKAAYANPAFGRDVRLLFSHSIAPTMLHSYGSPLAACPCGCRSQGFTIDALASKGLRGFGILSRVLETPRYLHPQEAGLLCTLPVQRKHLPNLKAALCLIGQIAAPLQALWVLLQVQQWFGALASGPEPDPVALLCRFKHDLRVRGRHAWLVPSVCQGGPLLLASPEQEELPYVIPCAGPVTVQDVCRTSGPFRPFGAKVQVLCEGIALCPDDFLHFGTMHAYVVKFRRKASAKWCATEEAQGTEVTDAHPGDASCVDFFSVDAAMAGGFAALCREPGAERCEYLPPCSSEALVAFLQAWSPGIQVLDPAGPESKLFIPFSVGRHWALLLLICGPGAQVQATLFDSRPGAHLQQARCVTHAFCQALSVPSVTVTEERRPCADLGFPSEACVLADAAWLLTGRSSALFLESAAAFFDQFADARALPVPTLRLPLRGTDLLCPSPRVLDPDGQRQVPALPRWCSGWTLEVEAQTTTLEPQHQASHDQFTGVRVGEATHPGPKGSKSDNRGPAGDNFLSLLGPDLMNSIREAIQTMVKNAIQQSLAASGVVTTAATKGRNARKRKAKLRKAAQRRAGAGGTSGKADGPAPAANADKTSGAPPAKGKGKGKDSDKKADGAPPSQPPKRPPAKPDKVEEDEWQVVKPRQPKSEEFLLRPQDWSSQLIKFVDLAPSFDRADQSKPFEAVVHCVAAEIPIAQRMLQASGRQYSVLLVAVDLPKKELDKHVLAQEPRTRQSIPGRLGNVIKFRDGLAVQCASGGCAAPQPSGLGKTHKVEAKETGILFVKIPQAFVPAEKWKAFTKNPKHAVAAWASGHHVQLSDSWKWAEEKAANNARQVFGIVRLPKNDIPTLLAASGQAGVFAYPPSGQRENVTVQWVDRLPKEADKDYMARASRLASIGLACHGNRLGYKAPITSSTKFPGSGC